MIKQKLEKILKEKIKKRNKQLLEGVTQRMIDMEKLRGYPRDSKEYKERLSEIEKKYKP